MPTSQADATVAIPWFNNIWFNNVARVPAPPPTAVDPSSPSNPTPSSPTNTSVSTRRHRRPRQAIYPRADPPSPTDPSDRVRSCSPSHSDMQPHSLSSSRNTVSTLSAVDRISLISLLSTGRPSASDVLRTLSDPDLVQLAGAPVALALAGRATSTNLRLHVHLVPIRSAPLIRFPGHPSERHPSVSGVRKKGAAVAVRRVASTPCHPARISAAQSSHHLVSDHS